MVPDYIFSLSCSVGSGNALYQKREELVYCCLHE